MLYYIISYCIILYYVIIYCIVSYRTVLYCIGLHYIVLHYKLHYIMVYYLTICIHNICIHIYIYIYVHTLLSHYIIIYIYTRSHTHTHDIPCIVIKCNHLYQIWMPGRSHKSQQDSPAIRPKSWHRSRTQQDIHFAASMSYWLRTLNHMRQSVQILPTKSNHRCCPSHLLILFVPGPGFFRLQLEAAHPVRTHASH